MNLEFEEVKVWADSIRWIGMRCEDGGIYLDDDMLNYYVDDIYEVVKDGHVYRYEDGKLTPRKGA